MKITFQDLTTELIYADRDQCRSMLSISRTILKVISILLAIGANEDGRKYKMLNTETIDIAIIRSVKAKSSDISAVI